MQSRVKPVSGNPEPGFSTPRVSCGPDSFFPGRKDFNFAAWAALPRERVPVCGAGAGALRPRLLAPPLLRPTQ